MKKILFLTSVLFLGFTGVSHAQLEEGNIMLGADLGSGATASAANGLFGFNLGLTEDTGYTIGISPKLGYFLNDNFVVGGIVNLGYLNGAGNDAASTNVFSYGVQAFSRYYLAPAAIDLDDDVPAGYFFLETNAGLGGEIINAGDGANEGDDSTNGFAFGFGPGYSLFLNDSVALEASAKYSGLTGDPFKGELGINVGIQVFLSRDAAESTVDQF